MELYFYHILQIFWVFQQNLGELTSDNSWNQLSWQEFVHRLPWAPGTGDPSYWPVYCRSVQDSSPRLGAFPGLCQSSGGWEDEGQHTSLLNISVQALMSLVRGLGDCGAEFLLSSARRWSSRSCGCSCPGTIFALLNCDTKNAKKTCEVEWRAIWYSSALRESKINQKWGWAGCRCPCSCGVLD